MPPEVLTCPSLRSEATILEVSLMLSLSVLLLWCWTTPSGALSCTDELARVPERFLGEVDQRSLTGLPSWRGYTQVPQLPEPSEPSE